MSEHQQAPQLSKLFPDIEQLCIQLIFDDPRTPSTPPSPQLHTLYSAASAFFRFACPCADCDGDFNLTDAVSTLLASGMGGNFSASTNGHLSCPGVRFRDQAAFQTQCQMQLSFRLLAEPHCVA